MTRHLRALALACLVLAAAAPAAQRPAPISYVVSFPAPEHHWLEVELVVTDLAAEPFVARMSRSSPGRYAVHEFAKNVFHVAADNGAGQPLPVRRTGADEWQVAGHTGTVRLVYRLFGDQADGTYLAVDTTHAHLNMPATFLWPAGMERRPVRVTFRPPPDFEWQVGTQLFPGADPFSFTAPNLQYFLDSPTELARFASRTIEVPAPGGGPAVTLRVMVHAVNPSSSDLDALVAGLGRMAREHAAVFGEFPGYEPGHYTFLFDAVPWSEPDAMEHRNSTMVTGVGLQSDGRAGALDAASHEFFHGWNVERIRPADLEPFDFTRQNVTCCLWLAEGFTQYYGPLLLRRAGLLDELPIGFLPEVINAPGRQIRSAVEMSQYAPFADAAVSNDPTDRARTFVSYYTHGAAIALALDLSLRERSNGQLSLDDYMRRLWQEYGRPAPPEPGSVARPYTLEDLRRELAVLTGDAGFADEFFTRYIEGRDTPDYARLLALAGYELSPAAPSRAWMGDVWLLQASGGLLVGESASGRRVPVPFNTPAYEAGLDSGDVILTIDGRPATMAGWAALADRVPGSRIALRLRRRDGRVVNRTATLAADPSLRIVDLARTGALTPEQRTFRDAWLGSRAGR